MAPALRVSLGTGKGARVSGPMMQRKGGVARAARVSRVPAAPLRLRAHHVGAQRKLSAAAPSRAPAVAWPSLAPRCGAALSRRLAVRTARAQAPPVVRPLATKVLGLAEAPEDDASVAAPRDSLEFETHGARRSALSSKRAAALWDDLPPVARLGVGI